MIGSNPEFPSRILRLKLFTTSHSRALAYKY